METNIHLLIVELLFEVVEPVVRRVILKIRNESNFI